MSVHQITTAAFEKEVLQSEKPVLVDFYADWCGPCKMLAPTLAAVAAEHDEFKIVSVNVDDEDELAERYGVFSIPCLVVFKNGAEADRSVGAIPKEQILSLIGGAK
ncbi:MAG: thioredoxin [Clostridia bacterium]|nr:thioredoxin [Clostridia bacterium]